MVQPVPRPLPGGNRVDVDAVVWAMDGTGETMEARFFKNREQY